MSAKPLPAHWAERDGLAAKLEAARKADREFWRTATPSERRARSGALVGASAGAAVAGDFRAEGPGLVTSSTSQTDALRAKAETALFAVGGDLLEVDTAKARKERTARNVRYASRVHTSAQRDWPAVMFTATCRAGEAVDPRDITKLIDNLRNWFHRQVCKPAYTPVAALRPRFRYVWVAELQTERGKRGDPGAVHYHVAVWVPPALKRRAEAMVARGPKDRDGRPLWKDSGVLPKPDRKGWWRKGSTERDWVRKSVSAYLSKYLSKGNEEQGLRFPKGLRTNGCGGFAGPERFAKTHYGLPAWLRKQVTPEDRCARAPGGGWIARSSGERFMAPFVCVSAGAGRVQLLRITPENFEQVNAYMSAAHAAAVASYLARNPGYALGLAA